MGGTYNIKCLVVDDDEDDQELFSAALEKTSFGHYTCIFAGDGGEAMDLLNTDLQPDYIFLDLNMPKLNGMQCLEEIRKQQRFHQTHISIYSTSNDEKTKAAAFDMGATAFISKPTRFAELIGYLNNFFATYHPTQGL